MKNCPQTAKVGFLKTKLRKLSFWFLNFELGSVRFLQTDIQHFHRVPHTKTILKSQT